MKRIRIYSVLSCGLLLLAGCCCHHNRCAPGSVAARPVPRPAPCVAPGQPCAPSGQGYTPLIPQPEPVPSLAVPVPITPPPGSNPGGGLPPPPPAPVRSGFGVSLSSPGSAWSAPAHVQLGQPIPAP